MYVCTRNDRFLFCPVSFLLSLEGPQEHSAALDTSLQLSALTSEQQFQEPTYVSEARATNQVMFMPLGRKCVL